MSNVSDILTNTFISNCDSEYDAPSEKVPENDNHREKPLRRWPTYYNITKAEAEEYQDETDGVREDVLSMISAACPNAIYDRNWSAES